MHVGHSSPITRNPLLASNLSPNRGLKHAIDTWRSQNTIEGIANISIAPSPFSVFPIAQPELQLAITESKVFDSSGNRTVIVTVVPPTGAARMPSDIVIVVDTSGSMGSDATSNGVESSGLNILDIVKHAIKTIISVLDEHDRLSIVSYSDQATIIFDLLSMNAAGKTRALQLMSSLEPGGMTNLWDGLHKGLEILSNRDASSRRSAASIFLLTDGEPNIEPPRGHIPMLQRYKDTHDGKYPGVISTFGFGYTMDSPLLRAISHEGDGMYAFIPDVGFVGTAFVNALANMLVTCGANTTVSVEPQNGAEIVDVIGLSNYTKQSWGVSIPLGTFQFGQNKEIGLLIKSSASSGPSISVTVKFDKFLSVYGPLTTGQVSAQGPCEAVLHFSTDHAEMEKCRLRACKALDDIISLMNENKQAEAQALVRDTIASIKECQSRLHSYADAPDPGEIGSDQSRYPRAFAGLIKDFEGQITEATLRLDWWNKWGKHYLPSLQRSHELQQCNNFKDPGIQFYGGSLFVAVRDIADNSFNSLPAPISSNNRSTGSTQPVSMRAFNSSSAPCFHGDCQVRMHSNNKTSIHATRRVADIRKGDIVDLFGDIQGEVVCVLKTNLTTVGPINLVVLQNELIVTPWHPVRIGGIWQFPCQVADCKIYTGECDAVYSFIVKNVDDKVNKEVTTGMNINGIECITLGHGICDDPVASHPFFGSVKVIEDLQTKASQAFTEGMVVLEGEKCLIKDIQSGLVTGLRYAPLSL